MARVMIEMEVEVPEGTRYVAVDEDCDIWAYEETPKDWTRSWHADSGDVNIVQKCVNWRNSLTELPVSDDGGRGDGND